MQAKKKIVVYYREKRFSLDPFAKLGEKRSVYYDLFKLGINKGFEMYLASGKEDYLGDMKFKNAIKYIDGKFVLCEDVVLADAVYDRSGGPSFPTEEINEKVLNNLEFKKLCADKMLTYEFIGEFMPESFDILNRSDLEEALLNFKKDELVVFKPVSDFGGKGVIIDLPEKIKDVLLENGVRYKLQRFVETSAGIEGIVDGRHDLRVIIVNGEIILAHVRTPANGGYLANVAQGGSIKEVFLSEIPEQIMQVVQKIKNKIDNAFDNPIYSIDFGIANGRPYVFELNDQIGFPREDMKGAGRFVEVLMDALAVRAQR